MKLYQAKQILEGITSDIVDTINSNRDMRFYNNTARNAGVNTNNIDDLTNFLQGRVDSKDPNFKESDFQNIVVQNERTERHLRDARAAGTGVAATVGTGIAAYGLYKTLSNAKKKLMWKKHGCSKIENSVEKAKCQDYLKYKS